MAECLENITLAGCALTPRKNSATMSAEQTKNVCAAIGKYSIIYPADAEPEEGAQIAGVLARIIYDVCGARLAVSDDTVSKTATEILIGRTNRAESTAAYDNAFGDFDYCLAVSGAKLLICGGGCFALYSAALALCEKYFERGIMPGAELAEKGNVYGMSLLTRADGSQLRIMSNNVWECDDNKPAWEALGEDCSAAVRAAGLAEIYMACLPDVICFQEMTAAMVSEIKDILKKNGYKYAPVCFTGEGNVDYTCLLYREDVLTLRECGYHEYTYGCNCGTKSYTWGYFTHNPTGKSFVALSTHLWFKTETALEGSDKMRADQAVEAVRCADTLIDKYSCPVFAMGDFNTRTDSDAYRTFIGNGFVDTFDMASIFADDHKGTHMCKPDGYSREPSPSTYAKDAIDHIMLKNGGDMKILTFNHVRPRFYIKLSDYYPLYIDAALCR